MLADLEGPGCISHIWMTQFCRRVLGPGLIDTGMGSIVAPVYEIHNALGLNWEISDPDYYRKILIKMYWDDQEHPSVLVPLGDFFCLGHSIAANFASLPFTASVKPEEQFRFGGNAAFNCYLPMPFNKRARIEVENQNDIPYGQYFYIDYELYREPLANDVAYFHAQWQRVNPCGGWGAGLQVNSPEVNIPNLDGKNNYVILDAEGQGHYIGCNLSVFHRQGSWWGEGDDMIFIDDDQWPPSLHGTGSEDYFNHAWGMQKNAFPMNGSVLHESDKAGYQVSYRFHLADPVCFSRKVRVTLEHGHANHLADDWSSTAYWYQTHPSKPFAILPVEERLPVRAEAQPIPAVESSNSLPEAEAALAAAERRWQQFNEERQRQIALKITDTRQRSQGNVDQARRLRETYR